MISQMLMIFTLLTIWISLAWGLVILFSAVHFWFKHSDFRVLRRYLIILRLPLLFLLIMRMWLLPKRQKLSWI